MRKRIPFLCLLMLCSACGPTNAGLGDGIPSPAAAVSRSPIVLTAIPEVTLTEELYGRTTLRIAPSSSEAKFYSRGGSSLIDFPNGAILAARAREVAGTLYVLLSVVDRTTEKCTIYRVHDSDGDWLPDASTKTVLVDSGASKSYVSYISAGRSGELYLLDRRCQDVFTFRDTDQDGWEDDWTSSPLVRSQDYPYLLEARAVYGGDGAVPTVRVYQIPSPLKVSMKVPVAFREYADTDMDGVADQEAVFDHTGAPPRFGVAPQGGVSTLAVDYTRGGGSTGDVVEAWTLDVNGYEDSLLGSVTLPSSLKGSISLSASLTVGDCIALKKSGSAARSVRLVWPAGPTVLGVVPGQVDEGASATLVISGHSFTSDSRVWISVSDGEQLLLSTTFVSATTLEAALPADTLEAGVRAYVSVCDQDSSGNLTVPSANFFHLPVRDPE